MKNKLLILKKIKKKNNNNNKLMPMIYKNYNQKFLI